MSNIIATAEDTEDCKVRHLFKTQCVVLYHIFSSRSAINQHCHSPNSQEQSM